MLNILFISSFLALLLGSFLFWLKAIARIRATGSFIPDREQLKSPFGFVDIIVMFFFWFVGQIGSVGIAIVLLDLDPAKLTEVADSKLAWMTLLIAIGQVAATMLAMGVLLARYRRPSVFGWQPDFFRKDLALGGLTFVMVVPAILIVQWLLTRIIQYEHSTLEMMAKNADVLTIAASWIGAVLVAPVCEEIFFRGVLQAWLQRLKPGSFFSDQVLSGGWDDTKPLLTPGADKETEDFKTAEPNPANASSPVSDPNPYAAPKTLETGLRKGLVEQGLIHGSSSIPYWPIFVSAAIFGLAHAGQGPAPIPLFLFGLALGYLFRKTGSILPCIVLHLLLNAFSMFWFTIQVLFKEEGPPTPGEVVQHLDAVSVFLTSLF